LENIVKDVKSKKEGGLSKYLPQERVSKTLSMVKDSLWGVYPELCIILSGCIGTWNMYKEPVINHLNTGKDYMVAWYKFFIG